MWMSSMIDTNFLFPPAPPLLPKAPFTFSLIPSPTPPSAALTGLSPWAFLAAPPVDFLAGALAVVFLAGVDFFAGALAAAFFAGALAVFFAGALAAVFFAGARLRVPPSRRAGRSSAASASVTDSSE